MKHYGKLIVLLVAVMLMASLAGCTPAPTQATQPPATQPPAATEKPTEVVTEKPTEPPAATEPVPLRYANWNLGTEEENNIQRQLIKAYTDLYPHVTIEFVDMSGEGGWDAILTAYAAKGELPDVFMANNVPLYVSNGWLADLSEFTANGADWANVPQALKDSFTYSGKIWFAGSPICDGLLREQGLV